MPDLFSRTFFDYFNALERKMRVQPLNLGGAASSGAGIGGPPGGFRGYLPQSRVSYDSLEIGTPETVSSGPSLWDNLNHIRYRLDVLESGPPTSIITVSGDYNADLYDDVIIGDADTGPIVITLPVASGVVGKEYKVKKSDSSGNTVVVSGAESEQFDGQPVHNLTSQYDYQAYITDGDVWHLF